jgi:hypothetical protein
VTQDGSRALPAERLQIVADSDFLGRDEAPLGGRLREQPAGSQGAPVPPAALAERPSAAPSE